MNHIFILPFLGLVFTFGVPIAFAENLSLAEADHRLVMAKAIYESNPTQANKDAVHRAYVTRNKIKTKFKIGMDAKDYTVPIMEREYPSSTKYNSGKLRKLTDRIKKVMGIQEDVEIEIVEGPYNAQAVLKADGTPKIVLTDELLYDVKNDDSQIGAVIAHELSHIKNGDPGRLGDANHPSTPGQAELAISARWAAQNHIVDSQGRPKNYRDFSKKEKSDFIKENRQELIATQLEQEHLADEKVAQILQKSGLDPKGGERLYKSRLSKYEADVDSNHPSMYGRYTEAIVQGGALSKATQQLKNSGQLEHQVKLTKQQIFTLEQEYREAQKETLQRDREYRSIHAILRSVEDEQESVKLDLKNTLRDPDLAAAEKSAKAAQLQNELNTLNSEESRVRGEKTLRQEKLVAAQQREEEILVTLEAYRSKSADLEVESGVQNKLSERLIGNVEDKVKEGQIVE